jgi:hypothetical protein
VRADLDPERFFAELVPEAWNREPAQDVSFSLGVLVDGAGPYHLRVTDGHMQARSERAADPVVTLVLGPGDFQQLAEEIGPSPMALLGGIGGEKNFVLTPPRLAALREVNGTLALRVLGETPWGVTLHFGSGPVPDEAGTTISIEAQQYRLVREGELDLQGAFMTGKLELEGDVEAAMKLALALMTPE